jgi:hypothetical protein
MSTMFIRASRGFGGGGQPGQRKNGIVSVLVMCVMPG